MKAARLLIVIISMLFLSEAQERTTTYTGRYLTHFPGPQVYKDATSKTLFYVESDGRHVVAISSAGKLLWIKDPVKDAHLPTYRTEKSQIIFIGRDKPSGGKPDEFIAIQYNNSQFGVMRINNGEFLFQGQD